MKYFLLMVSVVLIFTSNIYAGRMTDEWKLTIKKDYSSVISKLADKSGKTAEGYYLLGKAHYEKGDNIKAAEAWKEALKMTKRLLIEEGLFVGISSASNVVGALKMAKKLGKGKIVVTVAPDGGEKYMSTGVFA